MLRILFVHAGDASGAPTAALLAEMGYLVHHVGGVRQALDVLRASVIDVLLTDDRLRDEQGSGPLLQRVRTEFPQIVIVESGQLCAAIASVLTDRSSTRREDHAIAHASDVPDGIVASSAAMRVVLDWVARIGPTDIPVLLTGESGTGKELLARRLHACGHRRGGPFIAINCGAIPEGLVEAELFGYQKGAFTGAHTDKAGLFEEAHGGTVLLDEIGEMPLAMQVRLLRFLEDAEVRRLGQTKSRRVDVRVIAATNRNLRDAVAAGRYRADLYFRLSAGARHIPPLRERPEDIEALVPFWIAKLRTTLAPQVHGVSPRALSLLRGYAWPGNVRELRNVLEHALVLARGDCITEIELALVLGAAPLATANASAASEASDTMQREREHLLATLQRHRWNKNRAAESLGISRSTLWRRLGRYGLRQGAEPTAPSDPADAPDHS